MFQFMANAFYMAVGIILVSVSIVVAFFLTVLIGKIFVRMICKEERKRK